MTAEESISNDSFGQYDDVDITFIVEEPFSKWVTGAERFWNQDLSTPPELKEALAALQPGEVTMKLSTAAALSTAFMRANQIFKQIYGANVAEILTFSKSVATAEWAVFTDETKADLVAHGISHGFSARQLSETLVEVYGASEEEANALVAEHVEPLVNVLSMLRDLDIDLSVIEVEFDDGDNPIAPAEDDVDVES